MLGLFLFLAVFGSLIAPEDPRASSVDVLDPPSADHLLGKTEAGPDLRGAAAGRAVSIVVGFSAAVISSLLGAVVGWLAATSAAGRTAASTRWRTGSW